MFHGRAFQFLYLQQPNVWSDKGSELWHVRPLFTDKQIEIDIAVRSIDVVQPLHTQGIR
jgi:hypothetical protein